MLQTAVRSLWQDPVVGSSKDGFTVAEIPLSVEEMQTILQISRS
jgi:hypothetical protein